MLHPLDVLHIPRRIHGLAAVLAAAAGLGLTAPAAAAVPPDERIVGGNPASEPYPWAAALGDTGRSGSFCTGSLITSGWVLTAAHCVDGAGDPAAVTVRVGSPDRDRGGSASPAARLVVNPRYDRRTQHGDLALVRLRDAVPEDPIPVLLDRPAVGDGTRLLGWGQTCPTPGCDVGSNGLQELDAWVVSPSRCRGSGIDPSTELCVLAGRGEGPCYGDSGGPAMLDVDGTWALAGATSRGPTTCTSGEGAVYTRISAWLDWIRQTVAPGRRLFRARRRLSSVARDQADPGSG